MRRLGLQRVTRLRRRTTTRQAAGATVAEDRVGRQFRAEDPNPFWRQDGGMLAGARYDKAIVNATRHKTKVGLGSNPALSASDPDTVGNETRTHIILTGDATEEGDEGMFSFGDLLGAGVASTDGKRFVDVAVEEITKVRSDVQALLALETKPATLPAILKAQWGEVTSALDDIFENQNVLKGSAGRVPDEDDFLDELGDILVALSNEGSFIEATEEDGDGVFEKTALTTTKATDAFDRLTWTATATLGATASTRYGTVIRKGSNYAVDKPTTRTYGAFSYSTMQATVRASDVAAPTGIATYSGGTEAISKSGATYSGTMELQVRFSAKTVSGVVKDLLDADGLPWQYNFADVDSIVLSTAPLLRNATWNKSEQQTGTVFYTAGSGRLRPEVTVKNSFQGVLLGRGDDAGSEANGVWSVGDGPASTNYLEGGFGVTHVANLARPTPSGDDGSVSNSTLFTNSDSADVDDAFIADGTLTVKLNAFGWSLSDDEQLKYGYGKLYTDKTDAAGEPVPKLVTAEFDLASMAEGSTGDITTVKGPKHIDEVIDTLEAQRNQLATLQGLDSRTTATKEAEAAAWDAVQDAVQYELLGTSRSSWTPNTQATRIWKKTR